MPHVACTGMMTDVGPGKDEKRTLRSYTTPTRVAAMKTYMNRRFNGLSSHAIWVLYTAELKSMVLADTLPAIIVLLVTVCKKGALHKHDGAAHLTHVSVVLPGTPECKESEDTDWIRTVSTPPERSDVPELLMHQLI